MYISEFTSDTSDPPAAPVANDTLKVISGKVARLFSRHKGLAFKDKIDLANDIDSSTQLSKSRVADVDEMTTNEVDDLLDNINSGS